MIWGKKKLGKKFYKNNHIQTEKLKLILEYNNFFSTEVQTIVFAKYMLKITPIRFEISYGINWRGKKIISATTYHKQQLQIESALVFPFVAVS